MKWFFKWWTNRLAQVHVEEHFKQREAARLAAGTNFDGGVNFQLVKAENGRILKVMLPPSQQSLHAAMAGNPYGGPTEKLYVIPEGEDVMAFVTRALVEDRIK